MTTSEIRTRFLKFFEARNHETLPSASLVPVGDPSVLLTSAGMQQFKPYFSGDRVSPYPRISTVQKCFRATDIEEVGDLSHLTFFEMLGNFSFGDYFKLDAIAWARELVVEGVGIDPDQVWVTVYEGRAGVPRDDEAVEMWVDLGQPRERIAYAGEDNFWGPTGDSGPCGPTTEIHINLRPELPDVGPIEAPDQYLEIWNIVFNQYFKSVDGELASLKQTGVDTGAGLERWAMVLQGVSSIYETDIWVPVIKAAADRVKLTYDPTSESGRSLRVIAQHSRAAAFLIGDGVLPGNEGRGYILRRSLRQAVRHARQLGVDSDALDLVLAAAIDVMASEGYEDLRLREDFIRSVVRDEENRFRRTLSSGIARLDDFLSSVPVGGCIEGVRVFELYDTFGFPLDITKDIAESRGVIVDEQGFDTALSEQKARSRAARSEGGSRDLPSGFGETVFLGYEFVTEAKGTVVAVADEQELVEVSEAGDNVLLILDQTPFYGESGGQVGDQGMLTSPGASIRVTDTLKNPEGTIVLSAEVISGSLNVGDQVTASVDRPRRFDIMRNHTATHLLHAVLRVVLGEHVRQAGSLVAPDRLRFDFFHPDPVSVDELRKIQESVNEEILSDQATATEIVEVKAAVDAGAMALFGEKYGELVRMVSLGASSRELCGGTHCARTSQVGVFAIVQETGIASGVRRIEAVTGSGAVTLVGRTQALLSDISDKLGAPPSEVPERVQRLQDRVDDLRRRLHAAERIEARRLADSLAARVVDIKGLSLVNAEVSVGDRDALRGLTDALRKKLTDPWVILLAATVDDRPSFVAAASESAIGFGVNSGELARTVAEVTGGGGGGRPELAMAGGTDATRLSDAFEAGKDYLDQVMASI